MLTPPSSFDEERRLALLHELELLDSADEPAFDSLVELAVQLTGCPYALINLVDRDRQWAKALIGSLARETPREASFCGNAIRGNELFEVPDARLDPRFAAHPMVTGEPRLRYYCGVPLTIDGARIGMLCVIDITPRQLSDAQRDGLMRLAQLAVELISNRRLLLQWHTQRERMTDFAHAAGDWMWETDETLHYTWISPSIVDATGIAADQLIGKPAWASTPVDREGSDGGEDADFHRLLSEQRAFSGVVTLKPTPHGLRRLSRSATPVHDARGRFKGYRGTVRDITAQLDTEDRLRQQDLLLRQLSSQVPGMMFQLVSDGRTHAFKYVSPGIEAIYGRRASEALEDVDALLGTIHPDDATRVTSSVRRSAAQLSLWHDEYRVRLGDGRLRWLESRATPERLPDGRTLWHGFTADVTERKQAEAAMQRGEQRWELAAAAAGIGIAEFDLASGVIQLDQRACANHGLPWPNAGFTFNEWLGTVHPDDRAAANAAVQHTLAESGLLQQRYRMRLSDGREPTLELLVHTTLDARGTPVGMLGTCRDVSEQVALEQLRLDKEAAQRSSRAKSEFLSRVSHELRTPLNGILGFTQLIAMDQEQPLPPLQQRRLDSVQHAGRHLLALINDVLDLSRIEREEHALPRVPVDAAAALRASLSLIVPMARAAGVVLPAEPQGACWVLADRNALEQVLMNLLSNAIKYNRRGGAVLVTVTHDGDELQIAVTDQGVGLTESQRGQLFQHFNRLGAEAAGVEGSGLGLVISRQLLDEMGGRLLVHSTPGAGSTFSIVLPAVAAPPQRAASELAPGVAPPWPIVPTAPLRQVLYIEDEPLNALLVQELFRERPQWTLTVAVDGESGLRLARERLPDLLLIDMNLPDMDGVTLLRRLRADARTQALRCIALSADAMSEQIATARAAGFDDYWTKPINLQRVLEELETLLA